jgi:hypothetical protein
LPKEIEQSRRRSEGVGNGLGVHGDPSREEKRLTAIVHV